MGNSVKNKTGSAKRKRVSRNIRIIIEILIFTALVGITALLLQPVRASILRQMTETRDYLLGEAEAFLGRNIEYASMGPSVFASLDIRDIKILNDDGKAILTVGRLRVSYSLLALIRGEKQNSLRSIRIDVPVLDIDTVRDADILSLFSSSNSVKNGDSAIREMEGEIPGAAARKKWQGIDFLPDQIQVRLRGGKGQLAIGSTVISAESLSFDANIRNRRVIFTGRWKAETSIEGFLDQKLRAQISGGVSGDFATNLTNGNLNLSIPTLTGDLFTFKSLTVSLAVSPELIELRKIKDRSPYDLFVRYELDSGMLNAEFFADNFSPRDILSFSGAWKPYNEWLFVQTSGSASFRRSGDRNFNYDIRLSGKTPPNLAIRNASFEIKSRGDSESASFFPLHFDLPQGSLLFDGNVHFKPLGVNGNLRVQNLSLSGDNPLSADISLNTYGDEISIFSENVSIGPLMLSALDASILNQQDGLTFNASVLRFRDIESYDDVSLSRIGLEGSFDFNPRHLQASFSLDSFSLGDMADSIRPFAKIPVLPDTTRKQLNNVLFTTEVFITSDFTHISYNAPRFVAAYQGDRDIFAVFSVSGSDKRFELSQGSVIWENTNDHLEASGYADFSDIDDVVFSFQTVYRDFTYFIEGLFLDQRSLNINGSYGLNLSLAMTDQGSYSGSIFADSIPFPIKDKVTRFSVSAFMRWTDINFWSFDLERLEIADLPVAGYGTGRFMLQGIADNSGATFPNIFFDDGKGALSGNARAAWSDKFSRINGSISINDQSGSERYLLNGSYEGGALGLSFSGSQVRLGRFMENAENALLTGDLNLAWSGIDAFNAEATIGSLTGRIGNNNINAFAKISVNQDSASIRDSKLYFGNISVDIPGFELDRNKSVLNGSANISGMVLGRNMDLGFTASAEYKPIESWFDIGEAAASFNGSLDVHRIHFVILETIEPFKFLISRNNDSISLSGGPKDMIRLRISKFFNVPPAQGQQPLQEQDPGQEDPSRNRDYGAGHYYAFYAGLSNPLPFRGAITGKLEKGEIDASTANLYVDLTSLWKIVPAHVKEIIDLPGGFADVSVQIKGPLGDPQFFGSARGSSVRLKLPQYLTADIGPTPIDIKLEGSEMSFGPLKTKVGKGFADVSGWFLFDRWIPDTFNIDISVQKDKPIPYGFDMSGIMAKGDASGRITVGFEDQAFDIQGDLTAYNTILAMGKTEEEAQDAASSRKTPVTVNMKITTGPRVEFIFPSEAIPIISAYPDLGSSIVITADSETEKFSVVGNIPVRSGEIYYINRNFYIREGLVKLNENEEKFDPLITARAEINEVSQDGPVTISIVLDNAPALSFVPRFESNPPLSQLEIMSLLGQNPGMGTASNPLLTLSGDILAQFKVIQELERSLRNILRLDMFSIRTQALQNAIFLVTGLQQPVESLGNLGNYFDNTTVFLGKHLTQDMFLQSMFSLRYDDMVDAWGGLKLEADIGLELRSPLMTIRWNFVPLHPENMFIDDLSFTLSWKWSF